MTDQMVSQRCRLQARKLAAHRPTAIPSGPTRNTSNGQALPYTSSLVRQSPESQRAPSKTDKLLIDFPTNTRLRSDCYVINSHTHGYGKVKAPIEEGRYSLEVKTPPADQVMLSPDINSKDLARIDPETYELPRQVMLSPALGPKILTPHPAKSEDFNSALYNVAIKNDSRISSSHHIRTRAAHEADDLRGHGDWHTSLAIRH